MEKLIYRIRESPYILVWFVLINHIGILAFSYREIFDPIFFSEKVGLVFVLLLVTSAYISSCYKSKTTKFFFTSVLIFILISWQYVLSMGESNINLFISEILQPFVTYLYIIASINTLFLGNASFKRKADHLFLGLTIALMISKMFSLPNHNLLTLIHYIVMHFYPLLIFIFYRRHLRSILSAQRTKLLLFSLFCCLMMFSALMLETNVVIQVENSNIGWYISVISILVLFHLNIIYRQMIKWFLLLKEYFRENVVKQGITVTLLFIFTAWLLRLNFKEVYLSINMLLLIVSACFGILLHSFQASLQRPDILFLKQKKIIELLLDNGNKQDLYSNFLHNEVLQSIISIKNLNNYGENEEFRKEINEIAQELIETIREELDNYHPRLSKQQTIVENYLELIKRIKKRHKSSKQITLRADAKLILLSPYDRIIYRFIEELVTNSIKHSNFYFINIDLNVSSDVIFLKASNEVPPDYEMTEKAKSGLNFIENQVSLLSGRFTIQIVNNKFVVKIKLPIERNLCYENFID